MSEMADIFFFGVCVALETKLLLFVTLIMAGFAYRN